MFARQWVKDGKPIPNPGSDDAQWLGCRCPVLDNWRGSDEIGRIRGFVMVANCPLHGFEEQKDTKEETESD